MGARGKSINLYLMDGSPTGRIKCTLANWTGVAYKIPRTELDKCKGRDDLSQKCWNSIMMAVSIAINFSTIPTTNGMKTIMT